ncbi:MAG: ATP-binding protein [Granulosicoccus sp.]
MQEVTRKLDKYVLLLLSITALLLCLLAYKTTRQEFLLYQDGINRTVSSTARELSLYVENKHRLLKLFAKQETAAIVLLASQTGINQASNKGFLDAFDARIREAFPALLAYAIATADGLPLLTSDQPLYGEHCQQHMMDFSNDPVQLGAAMENPASSIHRSGMSESLHFDVAVRLPDGEGYSHPDALLMVSFRMSDIARLLDNGRLNQHALVLSELSPDGVQLRIAFPASSGEQAELLDENAVVLSENNRYRAVTEPIVGTPWTLTGLVSAAVGSQARNMAIAQAFIGSLALLTAGIIVLLASGKVRRSRHQASLVIDSVEFERKRIARDLHDQVLGDISHITRRLAEITPQLNESMVATSDIVAPLADVQSGIARFSNGIRAAIEDLHPHTLENLGLSESLRAYAEKHACDDRELELSIDRGVDGLLSSYQSLQLFRIAAELVNNSIQHSRADSLSLTLARAESGVALTVKDNGIGFIHRNKSELSGSYGLVNIASRVEALGAVAQWSRPVDGGTCFKLVLNAQRSADTDDSRLAESGSRFKGYR